LTLSAIDLFRVTGERRSPDGGKKLDSGQPVERLSLSQRASRSLIRSSAVKRMRQNKRD